MLYTGPVIDGHLHVETWFDANGKDFYTGFDEIAARRGVKALNIAALPIGEWGTENNIIAALYKLHNPSVYIHGGLTYPEYPVRELPCGAEPKRQYEEMKELGFDGIKILETKPEFHIQIDNPVDREFYEHYFAAMEADGTHILWHVCDPDSFWDRDRIPPEHIANGWFYGEGGYASFEEIMGQVFNVLRRHPKLNITFAHFFFHSDWPEKLEDVFKEYPNVNVDITPGTEMYENFRDRHDAYREFFTRNADRISFGTDTFFPEETDTLYNNVIRFLSTGEDVMIHRTPSRGLDLPEGVCRKILCENFQRKVSPAPKAMNVDAAKRYIEKYRGWIKNRAVFDLVEKELKKL